MELNAQKEDFSFAYVRAVAAAAGYSVAERPGGQDYESVDVQFRSLKGRHVLLEAQLKCTAGALGSEPHIPFPLPIKNYKDLRAATFVPRVLIVVSVPNDPSKWLAHSEAELVLRHCGYFLDLRNAADSSNAKSVTVHIPRVNVFSPPALTDLMAKIEAEAWA